METNKITALLDKYYSGDIMPGEYQTLLSALKENSDLTPELEKERDMLLAIEACAPSVPEGLEDRLIDAIDRRSRQAKLIHKMFLTGAAAAVILICITVASYRNENKAISDSGLIATCYEDFNDDAEIVDEALLDVLSNIHMAQNDIIESIESIQINPSTNSNI